MRILVASCGAYADAWIPFLELFGQAWPACMIVPELVTDWIPPGMESAFPIASVVQGAWPDRLLMAMAGARDEDVVLMLQEDFFPSAPWDGPAIAAAAAGMEAGSFMDVASIRLFPCPGAPEESGDVLIASGPCEYAMYGDVPRGEPYRVSCQATLWRVGFLRENLRAALRALEWTPSGFEHAAAKADIPGRVLAIKRSSLVQPAPYICTAIVDGIWQRGALELCAARGIPITGTRRRQ